jgi:hypothetical protein
VPNTNATPEPIYLPFDPADLAAAADGHHLVRQWGAQSMITKTYGIAGWPEMGEVYEAGSKDVAWLFYRTAEGLCLDDVWGNEQHRPATMSDLMAIIVGTLRAAAQAEMDVAEPAMLCPAN